MSPHRCRVCDDCQEYVSNMEAENRELKRRIAKARKILNRAWTTRGRDWPERPTPEIVDIDEVLTALAAPRRKRK